MPWEADRVLCDPTSGLLLALPPGAYLVYRRKLVGVGWHYGVLMVSGSAPDPDRVLDFHPGGWQAGSVEDFAAHRHVYLSSPATATLGVVLERMRRILEMNRPYSALDNNCEHSARYVVMGDASSSQTQAVIGAVILGGLFFLASRS